jgi:hypothetical protein
MKNYLLGMDAAFINIPKTDDTQIWITYKDYKDYAWRESSTWFQWYKILSNLKFFKGLCVKLHFEINVPSTAIQLQDMFVKIKDPNIVVDLIPGFVVDVSSLRDRKWYETDESYANWHMNGLVDYLNASKCDKFDHYAMFISDAVEQIFGKSKDKYSQLKAVTTVIKLETLAIPPVEIIVPPVTPPTGLKAELQAIIVELENLLKKMPD